MIFSRCANGGVIGNPVRQRGLKGFDGKKMTGCWPESVRPPMECFMQGGLMGFSGTPTLRRLVDTQRMGQDRRKLLRILQVKRTKAT